MGFGSRGREVQSDVANANCGVDFLPCGRYLHARYHKDAKEQKNHWH